MARALLSGDQDTTRALGRLAAAQRMAADGLAETRRAVHALRSDTAPLDQELAEPADTHRARHGAPVSLTVDGALPELPSDQRLSLVRTARECLINAAKHAPAQPVAISLRNEEHDVTMTISNPLGRRFDGTGEAALVTVDGGYGLTGIRERLLLLGGSLAVGAGTGRWVVTAQVPRWGTR